MTDLVVAESVYVLESFDETRRAQVAISMRALIAFPSVTCIDRDLLYRALEVYEIDRLDFAEAYLIACAEVTSVRQIASFDRSIDRVRSVESIVP